MLTKPEAAHCLAMIDYALTTDCSYRSMRGGRPGTRVRRSQAIFDADRGFACFNGTDLAMVREKVRLGLELANGSKVVASETNRDVDNETGF